MAAAPRGTPRLRGRGAPRRPQRPPASSCSGHLLVGDGPDQHRRDETDDGGDGVRGRPNHAEPGVGLENEQDDTPNAILAVFDAWGGDAY